MARSKKVNVEELTEKVTSAAEKAAESVGEAVQAAAESVKPVVKRGRKKIEAVAEKVEPAVKAVAEKAEPTVKRAKKAISEGGRIAAAALVPEVYLQWGEQEASCAELVERAKADYKSQNKGGIRSCKLYVKPEDGMVYYVINGKEGKLPL